MSTASTVAPVSDVRVVPGRECGSCTLCCKVYNIPELGKDMGKWCKHCKPGKGCLIHDQLPGQCAAFNCLWRTEEGLPAHWKPDQAKMVLTVHPNTLYIYVQVDPGAPSAWLRQPYHGELRQWAKNNLQKGMFVIVFVNYEATLIMPDQDLPLGRLQPTDRLSVLSRSGGGAPYEVTILPGAAAGPPPE